MKSVHLFFIGAAAITVSAFQNCAPVKMAPIESIEYSTGYEICTESFSETTSPVKIIFMLDASGSNKSNGQNPGSDPVKIWRSSAQEKFLEAYPGKINFHYNVSVFNGSQSKSLLNVSSGGKTVYYSGDITSSGPVIAAINTFKAMSDTGATPYSAALSRIKNLITSDLATAAANTKYVIVMLTDGEPTDYGAGRDTQAIKDDISDILSLATDRVSLNTVYYNNYQFTAEGESLLKMMAFAGRGTFVKADTNKPKLEIKDVIRVPSSVCH